MEKGGVYSEYRCCSGIFINPAAGIDFQRRTFEYIPDVYQYTQCIPVYRPDLDGYERAEPVGMGGGQAVYVRRDSPVCADGASGESVRSQSGLI